MGTYVTPQGLKAKTLQEIRAELTEGFKSVFGPTFETAVESPNGHLIGQLSLSLANLWQLASEVYASRDPGSAEGEPLDWAAALTGISRKGETRCQVRAMLYTDDAEATIPAGSLAQRSRGALNFALENEIVIERTSCNELVITDDGSQKSTEYVFHFTFGDITLNNTTGTTNMERLMTLINLGGGYSGTMPGRTDAIYVRDPDGGMVGITGQLPSAFKFRAGAVGDFAAVDAGAQTCEIGELDSIPSAVEGWDDVYNWEAGVPGTDAETDEELRIRRATAARSIKQRGTDPALEAHLMEDVEGVTSARVTSNRTNADDAAGRPPKSFEALVAGGSDDDVARCIYDNQAGGIQSWGNVSVQVRDGNGDFQLIRFSRPTAKYLWVKLTYSLYSEEDAPTDEEIKAALVAWASGEYQLGKDVIPGRILQGLYNGVSGIGQATPLVALTDSPDDTPSYGSAVIPVAAANYASLAASRITLVRV